jgi:hypothetical protein
MPPLHVSRKSDIILISTRSAVIALKGEEVEQVVLRVPPELAQRLRALAQRERRSMNAQMVLLLEQALGKEAQPAKNKVTKEKSE